MLYQWKEPTNTIYLNRQRMTYGMLKVRRRHVLEVTVTVKNKATQCFGNHCNC